jgi:Lsr2
MARKVQTIVHLEDDLDGGRADHTITFGWDGTTYEIDLSNKNAKAFEKAVAVYVGSARRVRGTRGTRARSDRRSDLAQVREWAKQNGYTVSERGRVAAEIVEAYDAAR